jgi:hypothetical protein
LSIPRIRFFNRSLDVHTTPSEEGSTTRLGLVCSSFWCDNGEEEHLAWRDLSPASAALFLLVTVIERR